MSDNFKALMSSEDQSVERLETLLAEQAALRRVATLAAGDPDATRLFEAVCAELGRLLGVQSTDMLRYEEEGTATLVAAWAAEGAPWFPVGVSIPVEGETVTGNLHRSGRPERVDDYREIGGELARMVRESGTLSCVPAPIRVAGRLWGAIMMTAPAPTPSPPEPRPSSHRSRPPRPTPTLPAGTARARP